MKKLETLSLVSKKVFSGKMKGEKRSTRRGTSVEFADYRNYTHGDDLRYIDWNTYARLDKLFIKLFTEEEDQHIYLLIDSSESMAYGEPVKLDYARKIAASLGYIGLANLDRVGIGSFSAGLRSSLPCIRGKSQTMRLFEYLETISPEGRTDLTRSLKEYSLRHTRKGIAIVISDFMDPNYQEGLKALIYRQFQVCAIQIMDESELNPAMVGDLKLVDSETGETREISISQGLLARYRKTVENYYDQMQKFCLRYGIDYLHTSTSMPFEDLILRYLRTSQVVG
jgi:uncharacterized protein (DUF58 family)